MAIQKRLPADLESLVDRATQKLLARDPDIGAASPAYSDDEYDAMMREWDEFKRQVAPYEQQYEGKGMLLSEIISEDRGE